MTSHPIRLIKSLHKNLLEYIRIWNIFSVVLCNTAQDNILCPYAVNEGVQ
jgi:predicted transcriptional regulator